MKVLFRFFESDEDIDLPLQMLNTASTKSALKSLFEYIFKFFSSLQSISHPFLGAKKIVIFLKKLNEFSFFDFFGKRLSFSSMNFQSQ